MGPTIKESPPSSPDSESVSSAANPRRRKKRANGNNGASATFDADYNVPHMLGCQLNPNSSMAQAMSDTLSQEIKAHSIYTDDSNMSVVGPPVPNRIITSPRDNQYAVSNPTSSGLLGNDAAPQTLDQLLERQWEQGSQFLMEQAQHFDISSLLSCLHQLRQENLRLEENLDNLVQRRDHLLAVNARLAIPLSSTSEKSISRANICEDNESKNCSPQEYRIRSVDAPRSNTSIRHVVDNIYHGQSSNQIPQNNSSNSHLIRDASEDVFKNNQR